MLLLIGLPAVLAGLLLLPAARAAAFKYAPAALCAVLFVAFAGYLPSIESAPISELLTWVPGLGLDIALYADGLALLFALLITGVGAVVAIYAAAYFDDNAERTRFSVLLMAFMSAMLGVVLAGNILTLFCAWELTSVTSFFLIGFKGAKYEDARQSALRALIVTGAGGLALLGGLVLMGSAVGSYTLTDILATDLSTHPWYTAITLLVLLGAFTKSAQVPFHFWLPGAMSAPSPASAYLHAATMVKAGVYLVLRMYPVLGDTPLWTSVVVTVGLTTFVWGAYVANRQRDMKGLLAYTTVSALGSLIALAGLPNSLGIKAALVGILAHGLYKAALFLITGAVEHATGTRDLDKLGGLRHVMPGAFIVTAISALSMAGLPPLLGFLAKDYFLEAHFPDPLGSILPFFAAFAGSALMVSAALTVLWDAFIRPPHPPSPSPSQAGRGGDVHGHQPASTATGDGHGQKSASVATGDVHGHQSASVATGDGHGHQPASVATGDVHGHQPASVATGDVHGHQPASVATGDGQSLAHRTSGTAGDVHGHTQPVSEAAGDGHAPAHHGGAGAIHTVPLLSAAPGVLAALTLILPFTLFLLDPLISAALGKETHLHLIPEHIEPLLVSILALGVGWGLMQTRRYWANAAPPRPVVGKGNRKQQSAGFRLPSLTAAAAYNSIISTVERTGDAALKLQSGRIRYYLAMILGVLAGLILSLSPAVGPSDILANLTISLNGSVDILKLALLGLSVAGTLTSVLVKNHLVAALALGVSGYALGGVFLLEPAPDVALVQILVETLGTVMLMLMLSRMDSINKNLRIDAGRDVWGSTLLGRWRDVFISVVIGGAVALIALTVVIQRPERAADEPIAVWHLIHTYPEIKITDTVGAIVTDFRGTDTLFEIVVFSMAALGVFTLLTPPASDTSTPTVKTTLEIDLKELRHDSTIESPLTSFVARLAFIFAMMIALSHWLYGGGQPGDGFTAGVIAGLAVSLSYIVRGYERTRRILPWVKPRRFIVAGLTLALGNAVIYALTMGMPFLRVVDFGDAPAGLHLSSTALFELAIGVTVFGAVTLIMDTISHPATDENKD